MLSFSLWETVLPGLLFVGRGVRFGAIFGHIHHRILREDLGQRSFEQGCNEVEPAVIHVGGT